MLNDLKVLKKAREILSDPARWTKKTYARTDDGTPVLVSDPLAVKFCTVGACYKAAAELGLPPKTPDALYTVINEEPGFGGVASFNDQTDRTHADVLGLFDKAITRTEAQVESIRTTLNMEPV